MTPERWQQIRGVLEEALELAPEQRSAFLHRNCSSDPSLRQEVETLLASSPDVRSSFLQSSPLRVALTPGTRLGEYEVKSLLGSGGMGEVYRARDARLGRDVAIKVLPLLAANSDRLWRFEHEARAAAALNHPNILAVFQMGTYEGAPYLVSELLEGETLRELLKRGPLSVRKAIDYGMQIARGLAAAHEKGIVHRDLKPENLFVTKDGRAKILDFGLAKLTSPHFSSDHTEGTEPGVVMGTVGYMAPEQVRGQTTDHRADIFAFGAILYEMLAGKRAFQRPTSADTMSAILNDDPPGISQVTLNIPPALQRVSHRCLEKNPEQRFQSASDLAFALDALSDSSGSALKFPAKDAGGSALLSFVKEHKLVLVAGLVLAAFLAGALLYSTRSLRPSKVSRARITHKQFTFSGDAYDPAISPDGLFVSYVSKKPGEKQKLIVQASNGTELELAQGTGISGPRWSPDGSEVLFERHEADPTARSLAIFVVGHTHVGSPLMVFRL
jgi:serine/threonine protein kinase